MDVVQWLIAVSAILSIAFFLMYVVALFGLPSTGRPKTPTVDRYGRPLPPSQNPGYQETEEETLA